MNLEQAILKLTKSCIDRNGMKELDVKNVQGRITLSSIRMLLEWNADSYEEINNAYSSDLRIVLFKKFHIADSRHFKKQLARIEEENGELTIEQKTLLGKVNIFHDDVLLPASGISFTKWVDFCNWVYGMDKYRGKLPGVQEYYDNLDPKYI